MEELLSLSRLLQFQSEACRCDLCSPGLARLLQDLESLADEVSCLLKHSELPQHSSVALLGRGLHLLKGFLLVHGDLQGLPFSWCSRLRQLQLAEAKLAMKQALRHWLECQQPGADAHGASTATTVANRLRLQLCLHLASSLTLGDTSVEEELATAVLSRLVALNHGCRYPGRTAARALQLLRELEAQAEGAPDKGEGCRVVNSYQRAGPRQQWQQHQWLQQSGKGGAAQPQISMAGSRGWLEEQLPGICSILLKLLRYGADIEALHLQLLADFMEGQLSEQGPELSSPTSTRTADPASAPPACKADNEEYLPAAKRTRHVGPGQASKEAAAAAVAVAAATAMPPCDGKPAALARKLYSSDAAPQPEWASQVALAKQVLRLIHFRDIVQHVDSAAGRLQQYAALLLLAELFRGHVGPGELASGDATWQVTMVAAGAAAAAGLQHQLQRILRTASFTAPASLAGTAEVGGPGGNCSVATEVATGALEEQPGSSEQPIPPPSVSTGLEACASSAEDAVMAALAADGLAHIALTGSPDQLLQGANTRAEGPVGTAAVTQQAQQAVGRLQVPVTDTARSLPQRVLLGCGLQLLAAPDYTSRRLGCNVVSLYAHRLAPLIAQAETAAGAAATRAAVNGCPQEKPAQASLAESLTDEPQLGLQRPAEQLPSRLQAAVELYSSLPGLDERLADLLSCQGVRTRLSALGAVHRIAALAPQLLPLSAQHVPALLRDSDPDAASLGVPQVAAATLGRLAGDANIRKGYQNGSVPQQLLAFLVELAQESKPAGDGVLTGRALWAATEGIEALARLVKPLARCSGAGCEQNNAAAVGPDSIWDEGARDGTAESMQQLVSDLVCLQGGAISVELLQSVPKLLPDLLKGTG